MADNEDTVIGATPIPVEYDVDDDTVIGVNDDTIVSNDKTIASRRRGNPAAASHRVPGRLSGGRVAVVPGEEKQRYPVRASGSPIAKVERTVIDAPKPESRRSRNIQQLDGETRRARRRGGALLLVAVPVVTLLVAGAVVAIILLLRS